MLLNIVYCAGQSPTTWVSGPTCLQGWGWETLLRAKEPRHQEMPFITQFGSPLYSVLETPAQGCKYQEVRWIGSHRGGRLPWPGSFSWPSSLFFYLLPSSFFCFFPKWKTILMVSPPDFSLLFFSQRCLIMPMSKPIIWRQNRIPMMSVDQLIFTLFLGLGRGHIL